MVRLIGQMFKLPVTALVFSFEMLVKTLQGLQRIANQGIEQIIGTELSAPDETLSVQEMPQQTHTSAAVTTGAGDPAFGTSDTSSVETVLSNSNVSTTNKEKRIMDKDLQDDMLKLVRFKVLFVRREYEHAFDEREDLVAENMDGTAFTAWKVAEFIQVLQKKETRQPLKWKTKGYPKDYLVDKDGEAYLTGLPDEDKRYLRVYYEVLDRYSREKFKYEEQQIRVLEEIRDKLDN
jgi:hypothetical protein